MFRDTGTLAKIFKGYGLFFYKYLKGYVILGSIVGI